MLFFSVSIFAQCAQKIPLNFIDGEIVFVKQTESSFQFYKAFFIGLGLVSL